MEQRTRECGNNDKEMNNIRPSKVDYYLNISKEVAARATCIRRKYGAIIVSNDEIIATGYCGAPRGCVNCDELGACKRQELNIPAGERYEICRSVHAEQNAILSASRRDMQGAFMYITGIDAVTGNVLETAMPCLLCKKMLLNSGIKAVVMRTVEDGVYNHKVLSVSSFMNDINE